MVVSNNSNKNYGAIIALAGPCTEGPA
jgi:hypothetical protein